MRKLSVLIISLLLFFFSGLLTYTKVQAEEIPCPLENCELFGEEGIVSKVTGLVRPITIIVFVGIIIYGGFTRLTAAGDPEKEKKSMQILTAGIIGFLIIVFAGIIVGFIGDLLGIDQIIDTSPAETTP